MSRPNFFLFGAPKCGTTALYAYLKDHPQVFFPRLKEPRFFAEDLGDFREVTRLDEYEALYADIPTGVRAIGDGSPWYLCSEVAPRLVREYSPEARIVVILRNPLDMLPSLHNQFVFSFKETETDLARAWSLQETRRAGRRLPPNSPAPSLLQYGRITSFGRQVSNLFDLFPREQVHVLLFDDFVADTRDAYDRVVSFLALAPDTRADFPVVNERAAHRNRALGWLFNSPASPLNRAIYAIRDLTGIKSSGLIAPLLHGNRAPGTKAALPPRLRSELVSFYAEDVALLSRILGRDLDHWLDRVNDHKSSS